MDAPEQPSADSFAARVRAVVRSIPEGSVSTYGEVAVLAGAPGAARRVGAVLHGTRDEDVPWQRVVNASGGISTHKVGLGELQEALLRSEGVEVGPDGVDMTRFRYRWRPEPDGA